MNLFKTLPHVTESDSEHLFAVADFFIALAKQSRREGILVLEEHLDENTQKFTFEGKTLPFTPTENWLFSTLLQLVLDGADCEFVQDIALYSLATCDETDGGRLALILGAEGIRAIQQGENPYLIYVRFIAMMGRTVGNLYRTHFEGYEQTQNKAVNNSCANQPAAAPIPDSRNNSATEPKQKDQKNREPHKPHANGDQKERIMACIRSVHEARLLLRTLLLEETESLDEKTKQTIKTGLLGEYDEENDRKTITAAFENDFDAMIDRFLSKHVFDKNDRVSIQNTLNAIGEDGLNRIVSRLSAEHWDELENVLRAQFFIFSDIVMLDDRAVQKVIRELDKRTLAMSLKDADGEVLDKVLRNMSERAAKMLKDDIACIGDMSKADIHAAQGEVIKLVKHLEDSGEIVIAKFMNIFDSLV